MRYIRNILGFFPRSYSICSGWLHTHTAMHLTTAARTALLHSGCTVPEVSTQKSASSESWERLSCGLCATSDEMKGTWLLHFGGGVFLAPLLVVTMVCILGNLHVCIIPPREHNYILQTQVKTVAPVITMAMFLETVRLPQVHGNLATCLPYHRKEKPALSSWM